MHASQSRAAASSIWIHPCAAATVNSLLQAGRPSHSISEVKLHFEADVRAVNLPKVRLSLYLVVAEKGASTSSQSLIFEHSRIAQFSRTGLRF